MTEEEMKAAFAAEFVKKAELIKGELAAILALANTYTDSETVQLRDIINDDGTLDRVIERMNRIDAVIDVFDRNGDGTDVQDIETLIKVADDAKSVAERALQKCQDAEARISGIRTDLSALQSSTGSQFTAISAQIAGINERLENIGSTGPGSTEINRLISVAVVASEDKQDAKIKAAVEAGCQAFVACFNDVDYQAVADARREAAAEAEQAPVDSGDAAPEGDSDAMTL